MGARGPQKTPLEVRERRGNPGKEKLPKVVTSIKPTNTVEGFPIFETGEELLQHILDNGGSEWIGRTDVLAMTLIQTYDDYLLARRRWQDTLDDRDFKAYDGLLGKLITCLSKLGLNPADRGALGLAKVKAEKVGLAALREKRKAGLPST